LGCAPGAPLEAFRSGGGSHQAALGHQGGVAAGQSRVPVRPLAADSLVEPDLGRAGKRERLQQGQHEVVHVAQAAAQRAGAEAAARRRLQHVEEHRHRGGEAKRHPEQEVARNGAGLAQRQQQARVAHNPSAQGLLWSAANCGVHSGGDAIV